MTQLSGDPTGLPLSGTSGEPWGHKLTVSMYIAGPIEKALAVTEHLGDDLALGLLGVGFMGVTVDGVQDEPRDQGGS